MFEGCDYADVLSCNATCRAGLCSDRCSLSGILFATPILHSRQAVTGGSVSVIGPTQFRPKRLHFQSQHAAERDPSDRRLDSKPTSVQPIRNSTVCVAVRAWHLWVQRQT